MNTLLLTAIVAAATAVQTPAIPADDAIEAKIRQELSSMTLEEKVGQMLQLNVDVLSKAGETMRPQEFRFDYEKTDNIIDTYKVGSVLNVPGSVAVTPRQWHDVIAPIQEISMKRLGVPCIYGVDQIHGTTYTLGGILFPQGINIGATFNKELARRSAEISAYETRAGSIPWTFAPVVDLGRDPRWPRQWENYGEDPYVNATMGRASVEGFQGPDPNNVDRYHVAACLKHYMGYGAPVSGKDRTPSSISVQDMREKHFAPFLESIKAGALSVMVNSAMNNGLPVHINAELLTGWLKEDLKWDGLIVTDWADIDNIWRRDHCAANKKEAIALAINAGIDMSMDPYSTDFATLLVELVNEGEVAMSRIDDAVARILRLKHRLGLYENPVTNPADYPLFGSAQHAAVALQAAEESMVLLKNAGNVLPLAPGVKVLVTGPNANSMRPLNGGWSYSWQGDRTNDFTADRNTLLEALQSSLGKDNVIYSPGVLYNEKGNWSEELAPQIDDAVKAAADADIIIACIGENSYCETPGNLSDLNMSANQKALVKALATTGKPIVLVLNEGRPRIIADIEPLASAVVYAMLPGNYGGDALARLLTGQANFSGKMPLTYPREINSLVTYDYKPCEHIGRPMEGAYNYDAVVNVQWPFGFGLSYTDFTYTNLRADRTSFTAGDTLTFSVDVTNSGSVTGKESVLLFSSDLIASLTPDNRRLRAFDKVELAPGETRTVSLTLPASDLAFVGYDGRWILEKGDFRIQIGDQIMTVTCTETYRWATPNR